VPLLTNGKRTWMLPPLPAEQLKLQPQPQPARRQMTRPTMLVALVLPS